MQMAVRNEAIGLMGCPLLVGPLGLSASPPLNLAVICDVCCY